MARFGTSRRKRRHRHEHDHHESGIGAGLVRRVCTSCGDVQIDLTETELLRRSGHVEEPEWLHCVFGWPIPVVSTDWED